LDTCRPDIYWAGLDEVVIVLWRLV
jgi:hypothetical protein